MENHYDFRPTRVDKLMNYLDKLTTLQKCGYQCTREISAVITEMNKELEIEVKK